MGIGAEDMADAVPDSFSVRVELSGKALRDLVINHPYVFEVVVPDDVRLDAGDDAATDQPDAADRPPQPPHPDAPAVAVIDSGIQEAHRLIAPAIDLASSYCWLPGSSTSVVDQVKPGGHGTRVAGAILYGEDVIPGAQLPCWVQNARVLDAKCELPKSLFPPLLIQSIVHQLYGGPRRTRIFNHSINANAACRTRHMSAWAAQIDALSTTFDVLVIQSAGNLPSNSPAPHPGIVDHLVAGRAHPDFLLEPSSRIANPGQALQVLTVGSVAYDVFESPDRRSLATHPLAPSSFSRAGPGIWGVIKPELVELGGDHIYTAGPQPRVATPSIAKHCYPSLVRSTLHGPGPLIDRDAVGTSFAAPKVTHIIAALQAALPTASTLLYRALVVHSARWPDWAMNEVRAFKNARDDVKRVQGRLSRQRSAAKKKGQPPPPATPIDVSQREARRARLNDLIRHIGYGLPSLERALHDHPQRTTHHTNRPGRITVGTCNVHRVQLPAALRVQSAKVEVLIEVTLSYAAPPRRTRRTPKRYLATWLDWKSNRRGESLASFTARALTDEDVATDGSKDGIPWTIGSAVDNGIVPGVSRSAGTVQKDWAYTTLGKLADDFCIAVVAHKGWSRDPGATVAYELVVSFEVVDQRVPIYEQISAVVEVEGEVPLDDIEVDVEV